MYAPLNLPLEHHYRYLPPPCPSPVFLVARIDPDGFSPEPLALFTLRVPGDVPGGFPVEEYLYLRIGSQIHIPCRVAGISAPGGYEHETVPVPDVDEGRRPGLTRPGPLRS